MDWSTEYQGYNPMQHVNNDSTSEEEELSEFEEVDEVEEEEEENEEEITMWCW